MEKRRTVVLGLALLSGGCMSAAHLETKPLFQQTVDELFSGRCLELARAGHAGDTSKIIKLINTGTDPNCRGMHGVTPLYWIVAAQDFNKKGAEALISHGANPMLPLTEDGRTAMHYAAQRHDPSVLLTLLNLGGNPNIASAVTGVVPLHDAVDATNTQILIEHGADVNRLSNSQDSFGSITPAQAAAARLDYASVLLLIEAGAKPALGAHGGLNTFVTNMSNAIHKGYGIDVSSEQYKYFLLVKERTEAISK